MTSAVERIISPEEQELARYLAVIEDKIRQVAAAQAELESLRDELARFNAEYHARVGVWLLETSRLEREIDELRFQVQLAQARPESPMEDILRRVEEVFQQQRQQHDQEEERSRRFREQAQTFRHQPDLNAEQASRILRLFRELAKRFHPDLAKDEDERAERTRRMQAVTDAFHRRSLVDLERLALSGDIGSAAFDRLSIAEKLVWAIREVSRLDQVMNALEKERHDLIKSAMYHLLEQERRGLDPLARLEWEALRRLERAQTEWEVVQNDLSEGRASNG